jgi:non-heme chloroperoxidase
MAAHCTSGTEKGRHRKRSGRQACHDAALREQDQLWSMQAGLKNAYESIKAFSETDFTEDLQNIDVPTLVMHGEDDQIVPVHDSARKSARLIKGAQEIYYPGAPHGLTATLQDQVNADLLAFIRS